MSSANPSVWDLLEQAEKGDDALKRAVYTPAMALNDYLAANPSALSPSLRASADAGKVIALVEVRGIGPLESWGGLPHKPVTTPVGGALSAIDLIGLPPSAYRVLP